MTKRKQEMNFSSLRVEEVAYLLNVSEESIRKYVAHEGLPVFGTNQLKRFAWPAVLDWYVAYRARIDAPRGKLSHDKADRNLAAMQVEQIAEDLRKTIAEADRLELKLAQERGEVVAIKDVEASIAKVSSAIKTAILAMPAKLASRVYGVKDKGSIRAILDKEARDLCGRLATIGQDSAPEEEMTDAGS